MQVGTTYTWKTEGVRFSGSLVLNDEEEYIPRVRVGHGIQGIGTGSSATYGVLEKGLMTENGSFQAFFGLSNRSKESHLHGIYGLTYTPQGPVTFGYLRDGHNGHPFVSFTKDEYNIGVYLVAGETLGLSFGWSR